MDTIWTPDLTQFEGAKYRRLTDALRKAVKDGVLTQGEKLPPVRDLAWRIKITPGTVARAYTILTDEGVLEAAVGRGTFVAKAKTDRAFAPLVVDGVPHNSDAESGPISLLSPVIPDVGQAAVIRELLGDIARNPPSGMMHYPTRDAAKPAREAVVKWLQNSALGALRETDIVLCNGGQNGILLVLQTALLGAQPVVYTEELSYPGIQRAANMLRMRLVSVPMDAKGMDPEGLLKAVQTHGPGMICTSPEVHNPTCVHTPEDRRREIVSIARAHDLQILDDDCYRMGGAQAASYRTIAPERTWYVSSISKGLTPALRIGYVVGPRDRTGDIRRSAEHSFFGLATPISDLAHALLSYPSIEEIAERVAEKFGQYTQVALNHLGSYDVRWQSNVPFVWLKLPAGWRASAFCQAAEGVGVRIRPAEDFISRDSRAPHAVRIAINGAISAERFEVGIIKLRELLDSPPERIGV